MPYINVKTNVPAVTDCGAALKAALGEAITAIPGKSEAWLMVNIDAPSEMYFKGDPAPCAMFEVSIFGKASDSAYDDLTCRLCDTAERILRIPSDRVYVKYSEIEHWGYNNFNF